MFQHRDHLAANEMMGEDIYGKRVIEIGSGSGAHSALFSSKGAYVVSMDLSVERVLATAQKLDLVENNHECFCLQGDAEQIPFLDNSFDIVYSNGVLHLTPDTSKAIREAHRVLKPSGKAVIMLYGKHSFLYWLNIFLVKGILLGNIFRSRNWLGRVTEWIAESPQKIHNPETKVYSHKEITELFSIFTSVSVRKNSFVVQQIPVIGKVLSRALGLVTGYNKGGILVYGIPWRNETRWELALGRFMGFGLNICATK